MTIEARKLKEISDNARRAYMTPYIILASRFLNEAEELMLSEASRGHTSAIIKSTHVFRHSPESADWAEKTVYQEIDAIISAIKEEAKSRGFFVYSVTCTPPSRAKDSETVLFITTIHWSDEEHD